MARRLGGAFAAVLLLFAGCTGDAGPGPGSTPGETGASPSTPAPTTAPPNGGTTTPPEPPAGPPNVLIVLTDDQRWDTMEVMPRTLRWFGRGGTTFSNGLVTTPLCCPSRASIFTGRYVHNHGVRGNLDAGRLDHRFTLQRYLRDAGYATAYAGKFLNNWDLAVNPPHFDRWAIVDRGYEDRTFNVNGTLRNIAQYSTDFISDAAVAFLQEFEADDDRPWFLFVAPYAPHEPWLPAPEHAAAPVPPWSPSPAVLEADLSDKPPVVQAQHFARDGEFGLDGVDEIRRQQLRTLLSVDEMVGRLFATLGELGEGRDTLAFFLSDNGFLWGEHGLAGIGLDTGKRFPYTEAVRVPFMMRWPGRTAAGAVDDRLAANIDLAPTILEAAGLATVPQEPLDGRSLLQPTAREELLLENFVDPSYPQALEWASIRTAAYQYTEWYEPGSADPAFREYYDLVADPWQLENLLAGGDPSGVPGLERLSERLSGLRSCRGLDGPEACP